MGCMKNIVLVCEDVAHRNFVTACLKELGVRQLNHKLAQWVASTELVGGNLTSVIDRVNDTEFPNWKVKCKSTKVLLVVVVDADADAILKRRQDFPDDSSSNADLFVVVIPRRNIETWVRLGRGLGKPGLVDDTTDYKAKSTQSSKKVKEAVVQLFAVLNAAKTPAALSGHPVWTAFESAMADLRKGIKALEA